jgi:hypothetical protein
MESIASDSIIPLGAAVSFYFLADRPKIFSLFLKVQGRLTLAVIDYVSSIVGATI